MLTHYSRQTSVWLIHVSTTSSHVNHCSTILFPTFACWLEIHIRTTSRYPYILLQHLHYWADFLSCLYLLTVDSTQWNWSTPFPFKYILNTFFLSRVKIFIHRDIPWCFRLRFSYFLADNGFNFSSEHQCRQWHFRFSARIWCDFCNHFHPTPIF